MLRHRWSSLLLFLITIAAFSLTNHCFADAQDQIGIYRTYDHSGRTHREEYCGFKPKKALILTTNVVNDGHAYSNVFEPRQTVAKNMPTGLEGEYIAFSLSGAERVITAKGNDYRHIYPNIYQLGGIRRIYGLVYDRQSEDIILVGRADPQRPQLTIDDLVVALRARFVHKEWPLVSIDPPEKGSNDGMQTVRFQGGIGNTEFGMDLFDADYRLKLIGFGHLKSGVSGLPTYWDLWLKNLDYDRTGNISEAVRFWFYPVLSNVAVRNDVAAIGNLQMQVLAERLDVNKLEKTKVNRSLPVAANDFTRFINDHFDEIGKRHSSFARLPGLEELVAWTKALEGIDTDYDLSFWLQRYEVVRVRIPTNVKIVSRKDGTHEMSGGVRLTALALRLKAGDISALKTAVLDTRPGRDYIFWTFSVGEWVIPTSPRKVSDEDINLMYAQAQYFQQLGYDSEAIGLLDKIVNLAPDTIEPYRARAVSLERIGRHRESETDFEKVQFLESVYSKNNKVLLKTHIFVSAAYEGDVNTLKELIASGEDVDGRSSNDYTALAAASEAGHGEIVSELLDSNANPDLANYMGSTPLMLASARGHTRIVEYLLDRSADINAKNNTGNTALQAASEHGHDRIVRLLLDKGADVDATDDKGQSALIFAVNHKHVDIAMTLLKRGASVATRDEKSWTAIFYAVREDDAKMVSVLLEYGADPNVKETHWGYTPLHLTSQVGSDEVAEVLIAKGANCNARGYRGDTPLHVAASHEVSGTSLMELLLRNGAHVNVMTKDGVTALMSASYQGHISSVKMLLLHGSEVGRQTPEGLTALSIAQSRGHKEIVEMLQLASQMNRSNIKRTRRKE